MPPKKTAVKDDQDQQIAEQPESKGEVAIFHAARLPYHEAIEDRFGIDKGQWKVLVEAIFPSAKSADAIVMALSYCKSRNLDIMKRPVHIVPMYDSARGGWVETVWPGISELRTTASRTKGYAGVDEAEFGPVKKVKFKGRVRKWVNREQVWTDVETEVEFPDWCRLTVYRIVDGQRCKFVGPKVKWVETYATISNSDIPNQMWEERPEGQLEKCAEAAALRRAFPEELGNELTAEEMAGRNLHESITTVEAAAEPAGAASVSQPQTSATTGQRDAAPPRRAPAAEKPDPITSGPIKADGPPRQVAKEPEKGPEPTKSAAEETKPHKISGNGHTFESWATKYCDLIKTSADLPVVYEWIKANSDPLTRLEKGAPKEFQRCRKAAELLIDQFRKQAEQERKAAEARQRTMDEDAVDPHAGEMDDEGSSDQPEWPTDPEAALKHIDRLLSQANADTLESIWDDMIRAGFETMFPPDREEAMAIYRKHEARVAP